MIAIAGGKGGCGKTTTTFGLARAIGRQGRTVRIVDLDRDMPDLHALAGVDRRPTLSAVVDGPERTAGLRRGNRRDGRVSRRDRDGGRRDRNGDRRSRAPVDGRTAERTDGVDAVLQTVPGEPVVEVVSAPRPTEPIDLEAALDRVAHEGPLLLDCPCGAGPDAAEPLALADDVVVVSTTTRTSLEDAAKTAAMARALGTPVHAGVIVGTDRPPSSAAELLNVDRLYGIPHADRPLDDRRVRAAYRRVAEGLFTP